MKKVYLLAVVAAVLFGLLMYLFLQGSSAQVGNSEVRTVVVAAVDIAPDVTITDSMLVEETVPIDSAQVNVLSSKKDVVGKCSPAQIVKGEQILSNMLEDAESAGQRLSAQIKDGMRAMTIEVDTAEGVGGYVKAGDRIDLMGSVADSEGNFLYACLIVENIEVVRVNEATKEGQTPYNLLTLTMTLDQCETVYAYQAGIPSGAILDYHALLRPATGGAQ